MLQIEMKRRKKTKCEDCGRTEKEHKGKGRGKFEWIGCDCCGRWFAKVCLNKTKDVCRMKCISNASCV